MLTSLPRAAAVVVAVLVLAACSPDHPTPETVTKADFLAAKATAEAAGLGQGTGGSAQPLIDLVNTYTGDFSGAGLEQLDVFQDIYDTVQACPESEPRTRMLAAMDGNRTFAAAATKALSDYKPGADAETYAQFAEMPESWHVDSGLVGDLRRYSCSFEWPTGKVGDT